MTRIHDPFTLALESIRHAVVTGAYTPGRPIVIVDEARRLNLSTTPVREALAWLCGEGLVERAPAGGFLAPRLDGAAVRDCFAFRLLCLMASTEFAGIALAPLPNTSSKQRLAVLLNRVVQSQGNAVLASAFERVGEQLRGVADAERRVFYDWEAEVDAITSLEAGPDRDVPLSFHPAATRVLGLVTPRSVG